MDYTGPEKHFKYYEPFFQKLKNATVQRTSFEDAINGNSHAIFLDSEPSLKSTHTILLLEQHKDIITPYPLAASLGEYKKIQEFLVRYDRKIGMLNPLHFYPAVKTLKDWLANENKALSEIRVSCHPTHLVNGYAVNGFSGTVQPLQRIISYITGKYPLSLFIENRKSDRIKTWILDYNSFQAIIRVDPVQTGWIMEVNGPQLSATADHTGLLRLNNEVEPRLSPAPSVWERSMIKNLEDFIQAVRMRSEPAINSLDGLASIILNQASEKSMQNGNKVSL